MTDAEQRLWRQLRARQIAGARFRRQAPIGPYIADFACLDARLVIEVDGGQHADGASRDLHRDAWLSRQGFRVLRFWNNDVLQNIDGVLQRVDEAVRLTRAVSPPAQPSPVEGEGASPPPQPSPVEGEGEK